MKKLLLAVLLSALVFPGAGHFYLGRKAVGAVLLVVTLASLYFLLAAVLEIARQLSEQILMGELPLRLADISQAIAQQQLDTGSTLPTAAAYGLMLSWLFGILDSIRIARKTGSRAS